MLGSLSPKNYRIGRKLALIVVLMGLFFPMVFYFIKMSDDLTTGLARNEKVGVEYYKSIYKLLHYSIEYRDAYTLTAGSNSDMRGRLRELEGKIDSEFRAAESADMMWRDKLVSNNGATTDKLAAAKGRWLDLRGRDVDPKSNSHFALVDDVIALISVVGDKSQLILDPTLDTYYLMAATTYQAPALFSDLGRLRTAQALAGTTTDDKLETVRQSSKLLGSMVVNREGIRTGMASGFEWNSQNEDGTLEGNLGSAVDELVDDMERWDESGTWTGGQEIFDKGTASLDEGFGMYRLALENLDRLIVRRRDMYAANTKLAVTGIVGGTVLALLVALAIGGWITGQAETILGTFAKVETGNLDARAEVLTGDELGDVARSLNGTLDKLRETVRHAETLASQQRAEKERLQADVHRFLGIVTKAAGGDFTVSAQASEEDLRVLADSFNVMVRDLGAIISKVNEAARVVAVSTQEIQVSTQQMARGAEDQALQIANTSSAVEEMAVSIRRVAENADAAAGASQMASSVAGDGGTTVQDSIRHMFAIRDTVQDAAERMRTLGESSLEIGEIVKVINNIANRTNLLALNATIEAAKAGESGKGFAVVADEVRKLADQTSKASNDIAIIVQGIQGDTAEAVKAMENATKDVSEGVQVAEKSGKSLERIVQQVDHSKELISEISMAAKQQAIASDHIVESMTVINRISRQTAMGAQQTSEATRDLLHLSEELRKGTLAFKLNPETK